MINYAVPNVTTIYVKLGHVDTAGKWPLMPHS
jgi:hypothetical protein